MIYYWWKSQDVIKDFDNITHMRNGTNRSEMVQSLKDKDVKALKWKGGQCYTKKFKEEGRYPEAFVEHWHETGDWDGISIDEFVVIQPCISRPAAKVLYKFREQYPDDYVQVWHAPFLTRFYGNIYRDTADMVIVETYTGSTCPVMLWIWFKWNYLRAKWMGILDKTLLCIGIHKEQWAKTEKKIRKQLEFIKKNCPNIPGIAFYTQGDDNDELCRVADRLVTEIFES